MTQEPVWFWGLQETSEAARVVVEGIGAGQDAGQDPGGPSQQQQQPQGGCQRPKSQLRQDQLQHPVGKTVKAELLRVKEEAVIVSCEAEINRVEEQGSEGQGECWGRGKTGSEIGRHELKKGKSG